MNDWADIFESHLAVTPPLAAEQLTQVPAKRGILLLTDEAGTPITMITAGALRQRLATRLAEPTEDDAPRRSADLREITRHVWWTLTGSHFETDWRFLELAPQVWPRRFASMLSTRKPWFVDIQLQADDPHFARTHEPARGSRAFGPFPSGRSADEFVHILVEVFGLCRHPQRLPHAPQSHPCAYLQMGKCHGVCMGKVSMEAYRGILAEAIGVASGDDAAVRERWTCEMKTAAAALAFEDAARLKNRLARLDDLAGAEFEQTAPLEQFRFLVLQPALSRKAVRVFFVVGPTITDGGTLTAPFDDESLRPVLDRMAALAQVFPVGDSLSLWRVGLVAKYLYSNPERRGVMHRWNGEETPEVLGELIQSHADELALGKRARAAGTDDGDKRNDA
jgi:excinuclease UvrABC nuclease subunit